MTKPVVIVGAGHAGVQAAAALREEKYEGRIVLVGDELHVPYHRPPLAKAYLKGTLGRDSLALRGAAYYGNQGIETLFGDRVISIDRGARKVEQAAMTQPSLGRTAARFRGHRCCTPGIAKAPAFPTGPLEDADEPAFGANRDPGAVVPVSMTFVLSPLVTLFGTPPNRPRG